MVQSSRPQPDHISNYPAPSDPGPYSSDQWAQYMQVTYIGDQQALQGPLIRYLNELAVTTGAASPISVATGAGMVNGHFFHSSEAESFTIGPAIGANRTDIVVMCENNTNTPATAPAAAPANTFGFPTPATEYMAAPTAIPPYSARLVVVHGNDGAGAPGLDTDAANLYMVPLHTYEIDNGGVISNSVDDREFCRFSSGWPLRKLWVPCTGARNATDGTTITRGMDAFAQPGFTLVDNKQCNAYGDFIVPEDYGSVMTVEVVVRPDATGNCYCNGLIQYGLCGENRSTHTDNTFAAAARAVTFAFNNCLLMSAGLAGLTKFDIGTITFIRDATDILDTVNDVVSIPGFIISYIPDE